MSRSNIELTLDPLDEFDVDAGWGVFLARKSAKMTQGQLAEALNQRLGTSWDQSDISELENGKRHIRGGMIKILANLLGRQESWFYEEAANYRLVTTGKAVGLAQGKGQAAKKQSKKPAISNRRTKKIGNVHYLPSANDLRFCEHSALRGDYVEAKIA